MLSLSLSVALSPSPTRSLLLWDAHAQNQTASRDSLYVCIVQYASQHSGIFPSPPLFAHALCVVRPLLCVLLRCTFWRYSRLIHGDVGLVDCGPGLWNITCFRISRMPQSQTMPHLRHWPNCCPVDDVIAAASDAVILFILRLFLVWVFSLVCTCIIKLTFCIGGQRS